jgi:hypothetical protein
VPGQRAVRGASARRGFRRSARRARPPSSAGELEACLATASPNCS